MLHGSGIATYLLNLIRQYRSSDPQPELHYLVRDYTRVISSSPDYPNQHRFDSKIYSVSEQLFYPKILSKGDVLHVPHYNAPLRFPGKLVVTVHDLCHLVMKEFFKGPAKRTYASVFLKAVLKKASKIITVSHFTEQEILKYFHIDQKKIEVIPNGLDPHFYPRSDKEQKRVREANRLPESYLLYVGNIKPHKNIAKLIKAYHKGWCQKPDLPKLVIVGKKDEGYDPFSEAMSKGDSTYLAFKDQVIFKGFVPYEDLPGLYSGAKAFLFPSLYEGFGFPPLEAMACGTAVLASNSSSLPEILNGHAVFIDPYDEEAISSAILQLCKDSDLREKLIQHGLQHVRKFSWEDSAEKHLEVYRQLESRKRNILFVDQYGEYFGGGQVIHMDLIRHAFQNKSWNVIAALPSKGGFALRIQKLGVPVLLFPVPLHDISKNPLFDAMIHFMTSLWYVKNLIKICRENEISILYCNGGRIYLMSWIASKLMDLKVTWHLHLVLQERQKWLVVILGKNSNIQRIIAVSETAKSVFSGTSVDSKISVLYNWVSPEFMIESRRLSRKQKYSRMKFLIIGRISPEKGQLPMLQSISNINGESLEITIAGKMVEDPTFEEEFKELVEKLKLKGFQINSPGFVEDVKTEISRHDFLIISSKVPEAFGISAIEAMARGVIVMANRLGSLTEFVTHLETGLFYNADDPKSLPDLIHNIQDQKFDLAKIRKNAYQMVKTRFNAPQQLAQFEQILEEIFESHP